MNWDEERDRQQRRREQDRYVWPHYQGSVGVSTPTRQQRRQMERRMAKQRRKLVTATAAKIRASDE